MAKGSQFVRYIGPVLIALDELGGSGRPQEVVDKVAEDLHVSDEERSKLMSSGNSRFENQVHWARFYLAKAGYIDASHRGVWALTELGQKEKNLTQQQAINLCQRVQANLAKTQHGRSDESQPPDSSGGTAESADGANYRDRLIALLKALPPAGFERLCQRLLRESGFEQVIVTGRSGDGGIDGHGVLQVNPFVSFTVLFQCKRYSGVVSSKEVRDFRGSMVGRTDKGILITTGNFSTEAHREALRDGAPPIELVNGDKLLDLFESLELGLMPRKTFELDEKFFEEYKRLV